MLPAASRYRPLVPLPPALKKVIFFGDSISDSAAWSALPPTTAQFGQWATNLAQSRNWVRLNANMIPNGGFEQDTDTVALQRSGFSYNPINCSLSRVTTSGGNNVYQGSYSLRVDVTGANPLVALGSITTSGMPGFSLHGTNGWIGGAGYAPLPFRCFLQPGATFTLSAYVAVSTVRTNGPQAVIADTTGGMYQFGVSSQTVSPANTFVRLIAPRTVQAGATDAVVYIQWLGAQAGDVMWIDNIQLEANTGVTDYADYDGRSAIASTTLGGYNNPDILPTAGENTTSRPIRVDNWRPDIVVMHYGMNDLTNSSLTWTSHSPPPDHFGLTNGLPAILEGINSWRSALQSVLTAWTTTSGWSPTIIVGGISNRDPSVSMANIMKPSWWATLQDGIHQMDAVTEEEVRKIGGFFLHCNSVPPIAKPSLLDTTTGVQAGVHPTGGPGGGMDYLYYRYVSAFEGGV